MVNNGYIDVHIHSQNKQQDRLFLAVSPWHTVTQESGINMNTVTNMHIRTSFIHLINLLSQFFTKLTDSFSDK